MRSAAIFGLALVLAGCMGEGDTKVETVPVPEMVPDSFLTYPNTQAPLAAGNYRLEVSAASGLAADTYHAEVTFDDGSVQTIDRSWSAGATDTVPGTITLARAGGLRIAATSGSGVPVRLVLKRSNGRVVATASDLIDLPLTPISSASYAQAYYDAVDADQERDTLEKWKQRNGFYDNDPDSTISHVTFRDALDLGYGRDMYVLRNSVTGRIAFFVQNYIVALQPGSPGNYGPLNVDAAIDRDVRYLKGTNAIEFSPANEDNPADTNGPMKITKFFTYDVAGRRLTSADLDGRGVKHMPGMCWACHGGQTLPLGPDGKFQPQALRSAKYNVLNVPELEYSLQNGYHRDQMEDRLRFFNSLVKDSYVEMATRDINDGATARGLWSADFALEMINGRYNGDFTSGKFQDDFVPAGWQNGPGQENAELLFKRVVAPHCSGCHALQGRAAAGADSPDNLGNAINFSSYTKFMANRSRIIDYVYKRGIMPMSLRNFENFWKDPDGGPSILAAALAEPTLFDSSSGKVIPPGRPVARAGADRTVRSPEIQLDGNASSFAGSYQWAISSPAATTATLVNARSARAVLKAPDAGSYVLALTVTNARGSHTDYVTYTVDGVAADQTTLTFADDIRPLIDSNGCTSCHADGSTPGIPVFWDDSVDSDGIKLYQRIMMRVNLRDPEDSRLLQKPTSQLHGGGVVINRDTPQGQADYNTLLNWIREGAVCGSNPVGPAIDIGCAE
ncbi:MAG: hypothetical protein K0Q68_2499 [Moraxellaceae bacterium]|jgi:hypothetical protein|nr:hypothetical protein [Moraxellaceae bacterium]